MSPATDIKPLRTTLLKRLGIGERRLNQLISDKQISTLLPRRLAILAVAAEHGISVQKFASETDLSQLRAVSVTNRGPAKEPVGADSATRKRAPVRKARAQATRVPRTTARRGRKVFVVHGRNEALRRSMFEFLRNVGLQPIEWRKAIEATGKGTPTVDEILDAAFAQAVAIVVLLTPDDDVTLKPEFRKANDSPFEAMVVGQARPNVLFEAGMAFGRDPDHTVMVQVGDVKHFSDVGGRHVTRLTNRPESRAELVTKLRNAGCAVDDTGNDWYRAGNFAIRKVKAHGKK